MEVMEMKINLKDSNEFKMMIARKGYSQRTFAENIDMSYVYLNQIINNQLNPSGKAAKKIADALSLEFDDIFFIKFDDNSHQ
jgi:DNA-binding XRE family transcriptional regulator